MTAMQRLWALWMFPATSRHKGCVGSVGVMSWFPENVQRLFLSRVAFYVTIMDNALRSICRLCCRRTMWVPRFKPRQPEGTRQRRTRWCESHARVQRNTNTFIDNISFHWTDTVICEGFIIFSLRRLHEAPISRLLSGSFLRITTADVRYSWLGPWASNEVDREWMRVRRRCTGESAWSVPSVLTVPPFMTKAISVGWYTWPLKAMPGREVPWLPW